ATAIIEHALREPGWLPGIVRRIERRSDALGSVFEPDTSPARLAGASRAYLLALYHKHAARQRALYHLARLPEALDRGGSWFSTYLKEHLRNLGLSSSQGDETFAALSQPVVPSVLA